MIGQASNQFTPIQRCEKYPKATQFDYWYCVKTLLWIKMKVLERYQK